MLANGVLASLGTPKALLLRSIERSSTVSQSVCTLLLTCENPFFVSYVVVCICLGVFCITTYIVASAFRFAAQPLSSQDKRFVSMLVFGQQSTRFARYSEGVALHDNVSADAVLTW